MNYFPIKSHPELFYSSYTTANSQQFPWQLHRYVLLASRHANSSNVCVYLGQQIDKVEFSNRAFIQIHRFWHFYFYKSFYLHIEHWILNIYFIATYSFYICFIGVRDSIDPIPNTRIRPVSATNRGLDMSENILDTRSCKKKNGKDWISWRNDILLEFISSKFFTVHNWFSFID